MIRVLKANDVSAYELQRMEEDLLPYLSDGPLKRLLEHVRTELIAGNDVIIATGESV